MLWPRRGLLLRPSQRDQFVGLIRLVAYRQEIVGPGMGVQRTGIAPVGLVPMPVGNTCGRWLLARMLRLADRRSDRRCNRRVVPGGRESRRARPRFSFHTLPVPSQLPQELIDLAGRKPILVLVNFDRRFPAIGSGRSASGIQWTPTRGAQPPGMGLQTGTRKPSRARMLIPRPARTGRGGFNNFTPETGLGTLAGFVGHEPIVNPETTAAATPHWRATTHCPTNHQSDPGGIILHGTLPSPVLHSVPKPLTGANTAINAPRHSDPPQRPIRSMSAHDSVSVPAAPGLQPAPTAPSARHCLRTAGLAATLGLGLALASPFSLPTGAEAQLPPATAPLFWPDRNGPTMDGILPEDEAAAVPLEWNESEGKGIAWKVPLAREGHSTPVIGGDLVWFTSATEDGKQQYIHAINRHDGSVVHEKLLFENEDPEELGNPLNNYAAPSCVLDEDAVYVHFGTYGTARLDPVTAEVVWQRRDIEARHYRGPGSSPALYGDLLILTFDGIDHQFVKALNKDTGETVWRTDRSTDFDDLGPDGLPKLEGDFRKAYGTPSFMEVDGRVQVISVGARAAFGYDLLTGEEIWTVRHPDYNSAVRPMVHDGVVYINTGTGARLIAVRIDADATGDITESHVLWHRERRNAQLAGSVIVGDHLYQITNAGIGVCVDLADGEELWTERLGAGQHVASAIVAGDRVYFISEIGNATVVAAKPEFELLAENTTEEGMRASPAVAEGAIYLRTSGHLYKIVAE